MNESKGWYYTNLPHFDAGEACQFITFRLSDTVSQSKIHSWKEELRFCSNEEQSIEIEKRLQKWLDQGYGECWL